MGTLHGFVDGATVTHIPSITLKSVILENGSSESILRMTFTNGVSLCAARPSVVRVQMDNGAERALEVDTADGGFMRLAFRATARPEQLDGLALAELIANASTERCSSVAGSAGMTEPGNADSPAIP